MHPKQNRRFQNRTPTERKIYFKHLGLVAYEEGGGIEVENGEEKACMNE